MDRQSALIKIGFAVLAFNSALAIRNSWGDAGSVAFVLTADAALALLFVNISTEEAQDVSQEGRPKKKEGRARKPNSKYLGPEWLKL
ncbi:unnamed protein product [Urochloa humidicola]